MHPLSTGVPVPLTPRQILESVDELLVDAERREPFVPDGARATVAFERVWINGAPHIVKYLHADDDFMLRALGDPGSRTLRAFEAGLFDTASDAIDHAVVGAARGIGRNRWGYALLMRDVSADLASTDDEPFSDNQHHSFIEHLARMCASTWNWRDDIGLAPYASRWMVTSPAVIEAERTARARERVVPIIEDGWSKFGGRVPRDIAVDVDALRREVFPLADALATTPSCFLHGDWKASNLGTAADGRTVLIDWVYLGEGPACHELGWYLALNRQKLPASKEQVIADFRAALERNGVVTDGWWDRQLALALLGTLVEFGWEKALGDEAELLWWCERAREGLRCL